VNYKVLGSTNCVQRHHAEAKRQLEAVASLSRNEQREREAKIAISHLKNSGVIG